MTFKSTRADCRRAASLDAGQDVTEWVPAVTVVLCIGLTFSIASGVGIGAILFVLAKYGAGEASDVPTGLKVLAAAFVAKVVLLGV